MSTQAPTFTQPLQSVVALEGSAATFEAQVSGKRNLWWWRSAEDDVMFDTVVIYIGDTKNGQMFDFIS